MGLWRKASAKESKLGVPEQRPEGQAAGQQPGSVAGVRGSGTTEARARPNVEVINRRAEGTSELNRRLGAVEKSAGLCNAAALPEIMAGALQKSKHGVPEPFHEGRTAGKQQGNAAGARGSGAAEARARPNVEVNRRAEGTSELNRRLGAVEQGDWALERCGVAGDYGRGLTGKQGRCARAAPRWPSNRQATG